MEQHREMKEYPTPVKTSRGCRPRAVLSLIGGVSIHLALGAYYTFGNMAPYIISYLRLRAGEPGLANVDSLWISNVAVIPGPIAVLLSGILEKRLGIRWTVTIGSVIYSFGVAITYFAIKQSLPLVCVSYGACVSFGSFLTYGVPVQTAARWFPKHPTLVIGIILCGYGGSSLIMNQVITEYINPSNLSPDLETDNGEKYFTDSEMLDRIPYIFLILSAIYVCLQIVGVALMSEPPNETDIETQHDETKYSPARPIKGEPDERTPILGETEAITDTACEENVNCQSLHEVQESIDIQKEKKERKPIKQVLLTMVKNRNSYIIFFWMFFVFSGMQFNITLYKAYGQTFISDDKFLALVGSLAAVFNCTFRPIWGFIMDKYGFQVTTKVLAATFVCIMTTISLTEKLGKVAFMVWICASYGSFCGIFPIGPSTMGKLYGNENIIINMAFTFLAVSGATLFGGFSGLTLKNTIGWHGLFLMSGCLGTVAFISSFFFNGKDENGKDI